VTEKFTGQMRDQESGTDYFNARQFTAALGRFNSADPGNAGASFLSSQSWNGYGYVGGNPLVYTDPSGEDFGGFLNWIGGLFGFGSGTESSGPTFYATGYCYGCISDPGPSGAGAPSQEGGGGPMFYGIGLYLAPVSTPPILKLNQVPAAAQQAVANAPVPCLVVIGGSRNISVDRKRLSSAASAIQWFDGRQPLPQQFPSFLSQYKNGDATNAVPSPYARPTNSVILWAAFFSPQNTLSSQLSTLFHEITHPFLGLGDQGMLDRFNILNTQPPANVRSTYRHPGGPSEIYIEWLNDQCPQ